MAFHVGQRVVCVDDASRNRDEALPPEWFYDGDLDGLRRGSVYTVRAVTVDPIDGLAIVLLAEILRTSTDAEFEEGLVEPGYALDRFRPLCESRLDQFRAHLAPAPKTRVSA